jgi:DNA-directed RNA polymerase subunit RPC12/RpoP
MFRAKLRLKLYKHMAKCDYCGSTIIFGGKRDANGRFCNQKCQARGGLLAVSRQLPEPGVQEQVWKAHQGLCPKCKGAGPVDVHVGHKVWSALLLTSWSSTPQISCRSCGLKTQLGNAVFSLVLGWWGFPWGLLLTPIQIGRNLYGIANPPDPSKPSAQFEKIVRMNIAAGAIQQQKAQAVSAGVTSL